MLICSPRRAKLFRVLGLRPLLKYPATLFLLLLIGYSQMFAHVYRGIFVSPVKSVHAPDQSATLQSVPSGKEEFLFEEQELREEKDEHLFFKRYVEISHFVTLLFPQSINSQVFGFSAAHHQTSYNLSFINPSYLAFKAFRI